MDRCKHDLLVDCPDCLREEIDRLTRENEAMRKALEPFAGKLPSLRKSEIDFDGNGLRRCMSPMEIACRNVRSVLFSLKESSK